MKKCQSNIFCNAKKKIKSEECIKAGGYEDMTVHLEGGGVFETGGCSSRVGFSYKRR